MRHAIERHWQGWDAIAALAEQDGVKGRWGKPPTANAMRRVMTRVVGRDAQDWALASGESSEGELSRVLDSFS